MDSATGAEPPQGGLQLNWLTLAFSGPEAHLEEAFIQDYAREALPQMRVALLLGVAFYGIFGLLDHLLFPVHSRTIWFIRFALVCPMLLLGTLLGGRTWFRRWMQPYLALTILVAGLGIVTMLVVLPKPGGLAYYPGLILVLLFAYTFVRARFLWAAAAGALVVAAYEVVAAQFAGTGSFFFVSSSFFVVGSSLAGSATCYGMEYAARRSFHLRHLLEEEREKVRQANSLLETRVQERTAELVKAYELLQEEMAERQKGDEERLRLQQQLKHAEKLEAVGKLAAGVAHDLNNMLVGLVGLPDMLLLELEPGSRLHTSMATIRKAGLKAAAVVQDLLTLSRQGTTEKKVLQLDRVVRDYLDSPEHQQLLKERPGMAFRVTLAGDLLNLRGSPIHLGQALMNLVLNAFEANLVDGTVTLSTRNAYLDGPFDAWERIPEGEYVVLHLADTGTGIAEADLHHIFEPFYSKKKLGRSGTGLGMTLIWSVVKEHGGYIDLQSREGEGTWFDLYLPATREPLSEVEAYPALEDCRGTEQVAVIDDVPEQREVAVQMLRKLGYAAWSAASGEEAIARLQEAPADILVLDMIMDPGIDGCETYRRATTLRPGQKAVIASGFSDSERVREAQRLGAGEYIRKPYTLERLARAVRAELDRPPRPPET